MRHKIFTLEELSRRVNLNRRTPTNWYGYNIVLCHGCYDLITIGHVKHLQAAREIGNIGVGVHLVVTITPDDLVNKGPDRPIFTQELRAEMLASLEVVDFVAINKWSSAVETIKLLKPDFYVKGAENIGSTHPGFLAECEAMDKIGGSVRFTKEPTFHTTEVMAKLCKSI